MHISALIEPRSKDEDSRRREYILNIILVASIVAFVFLDGLVGYYRLMLGNHPSGVSFALFSLLPAFFIFLYALSRRGFFVLASYLFLAAYFAANSYGAYSYGAAVPTSLLSYALFIVITSILISTRFGFLVTAVTGIYIFFVWHLQRTGALAAAPQTFTDGDGIALVVLYGLIMVIAWLSNREIERSLLRARTSERKLKEERDLLEIKVDERTRELRATQLEKIDQLYRFAEFGQLASGLLHDMVNLLNAMSLGIEHQVPEESGVARQIEQFTSAIRKQLGQGGSAEKFLLADGVAQVVQLLSYQAKQAGIRLVFGHGADGDAMEYFGSPFKFHQVVMNLILNAIESFDGIPREPDGGKKITVQLACQNGDAILAVEDNGCGIPENIRAKIFDSFFTTKFGKQGKGIGIGLAITKRIVEEELHGAIDLLSSEKGTAFTVRFPLDLNQNPHHEGENNPNYPKTNRGDQSQPES